MVNPNEWDTLLTNCPVRRETTALWCNHDKKRMGEEFMKRDFLKSLGIEDKDIIDKIMDENSSDIGKAKGELETYKTKVTELEGTISNKDKELETLKKSVGDTTALSDQIKQLELDKAELTSQLDTKVNQLQKTHAIESGLRDAKAKNIKSVMALLDMDKITYTDGKLEGFTEQIDTLTKSEDSSFLFGGDSISGATLSTPPTNGGIKPPTSKTFAEAIANSLSK